MFTASPIATTTSAAWHQRRAWQRYAHELLRYYSRSSRYRLQFITGGKGPLAAVAPTLRRVVVRTQFPEPAGCLPIRHRAALEEAPTRLWLEGLLSHEAGHIRFSGEKPEGLLGELWNALEDERMERLMAVAHPRLEADYDTMGDVKLDGYEKSRQDGETYTDLAAKVLDSALLWRWSHDHREPPPLPLDEEAFEPIRPLVEAAWEADSSEEAGDLAREVLDRMGLDPDAEAPKSTLALPDLPAAQPAGGGTPSDEEDDASDDDRASAPGAGGDEGDEDASGGGDPSDGDNEVSQGQRPQAPDLDPNGKASRQARALLDGRRAEASRLAEALKPKAARRLPVPHRGRGRFDYRRYARGAERCFRQRPEAPEPPARLTVVLDASESMGWRGAADQTRFTAALEATALTARAAEIAAVEIDVIPFQRQPLPRLPSGRLPSGRSGHERLRIALTRLRAHGDTRLAPALRVALAERSEGLPPSHRGRHVILLLTDGLLRESDGRACEKLLRRARAARRELVVVPFLLEDPILSALSDVSPAPYQALFGRVCPVSDAAEIPDAVGRWLRRAARAR